MLIFKLILLIFSPLMTKKPTAEPLAVNALLCMQNLEGISN